jgi:hypothetical protein
VYKEKYKKSEMEVKEEKDHLYTTQDRAKNKQTMT